MLGRLVSNPARLTGDYLAGKHAPQILPLRLFLAVLLVLFLITSWATRDVRTFHFNSPPPEAQTELTQAKITLGLPPAWDKAAGEWMRAHLSLALAHPADLVAAMQDRAEDFAFLMLPVSALILAAIFALRRGFVLSDHLVFSMHSLSFQGLLIGLCVLAGTAWPLWAAPVHLFAHLRRIYHLGVAGTLALMVLLFLLSGVAFPLLLPGLVVAGLHVLRA